MFDIPQWILGYFIFPTLFILTFVLYLSISVKLITYLCSQLLDD